MADKNKIKKWFKYLITNSHTASKSSKNKKRGKNKLKSRDRYAKQVAKIISKYHNKEQESFIFGLSGKWGAGKTTFLDILESELESKELGFTVLSVSPWKFGSEETTFLRNFLKELNKKADEVKTQQLNLIEEFRYNLQNRNFLSNLDKDISKPTFELNRINVLLILVILTWLVYKLLVSIEHGRELWHF